jgi:hypothetical protein
MKPPILPSYLKHAKHSHDAGRIVEEHFLRLRTVEKSDAQLLARQTEDSLVL